MNWIRLFPIACRWCHCCLLSGGISFEMYLILPAAIRYTVCCKVIRICFVSIWGMIIFIVVSPRVIIIIIPFSVYIPILFMTLPIEVFLIRVDNRLLHHDRLPEVILILVAIFIAMRFELLRIL